MEGVKASSRNKMYFKYLNTDKYLLQVLLRVKKKYVVSFFSVTVKTKIGIISKPELWLNLVWLKYRGAAEMATSAETPAVPRTCGFTGSEKAIALTAESLSQGSHPHCPGVTKTDTTGWRRGRFFLKGCKRTVWFQVVWVILGCQGVLRSRVTFWRNPLCYLPTWGKQKESTS